MILSQSLPHGKDFLLTLALTDHALAFVLRFLLACILYGPTLSAAVVAATVRTHPRHRGNVLRFLRRLSDYLRDDCLEALGGNLLLDQPARGTWIFILDQTYCGHNSSRMENAYTTSPRGKRPKQVATKEKRKKRQKQPQSYCHCFVVGLLLTPSGWRLPVFKSYYTQKYCALRRLPYCKQTQLAAQLIDGLRVPAGAQVVVLGDTAFDAEAVLAACTRRQFGWIVAMNHDRVLAGPAPRPKVTTLAATASATEYVPVRLTPGQGRYPTQRRAAACRVGLKAKSRQFWVQRAHVAVHHVGTCVVLFSTMQPVQVGQQVAVQKVLLTNLVERTTIDLLELYDLRWQIELFFKEMKSTLGLDRYRFGDFACVESWVRLCLVAFVYLEWYRLRQLAQTRAGPEKRRWRWQRCHGLCQAVRQDIEAEDLQTLCERLQNPAAVPELIAQLRRAVPKEYRKAS